MDEVCVMATAVFVRLVGCPPYIVCSLSLIRSSGSVARPPQPFVRPLNGCAIEMGVSASIDDHILALS